MSRTNAKQSGTPVNRKYALGIGAILIVLVVFGGLAASPRQTTMNDARTVNPNWRELMKSMKDLHAAMYAVQPSGNDDEDFVNLMLPHHKAAVEMAKAELLHGSNPQMRRLAQEIITDQESEIQLMRLWLEQHKAGLTNQQQPQSSSLPKEK